jgi:hypothetical protein
MERFWRFLKKLSGLSSKISDLYKPLAVVVALFITIAGPQAPKVFSANWASSPIVTSALPLIAAVIFGAFIGWAWVTTAGAAIAMSDLLPDAYGKFLGVRLTNKGAFGIAAARLMLLTIHSADGERRDLLDRSRPISLDDAAFPMRGHSAFVPVIAKAVEPDDSLCISICVAPTAVKLSKLVGEEFAKPVIITIRADCGSGVEGNTEAKTFLVTPQPDGSCIARRLYAAWIEALRRWLVTRLLAVSFAQPRATVSELDRFVGRWHIFPSDSEPADFILTLDRAYGATKSHCPHSMGLWRIEGNEAHIVWDDGWWDALRPQSDGKVVKAAFFGTGKRWNGPPSNQQIAEKLP